MLVPGRIRDFFGRHVISRGGTLEKAIQALLERAVYLPRSSSHLPWLLVGPAAERLGKLPIERLYVSDSVSTPEKFPVPIQVSSVASLLTAMIQRLHMQEPIGDLVGRQ